MLNAFAARFSCALCSSRSTPIWAVSSARGCVAVWDWRLLGPDIKETVLGSAEIQKVFAVSNAGKIAGSKVLNGEIKSKSKARIIRDGVVVYTGEIVTIFREKDQVKEVGSGLECGISIKDFIDFKEKDVIESFLAEEVQRSI